MISRACGNPEISMISVVLTEEPLAPETTINCRLLSGNNFSRPAGIVALLT